jgi:hypothetical protein
MHAPSASPRNKFNESRKSIGNRQPNQFFGANKGDDDMVDDVRESPKGDDNVFEFREMK